MNEDQYQISREEDPQEKANWWEYEMERQFGIRQPQDGRICGCEDAPCCGHYDL